MPRTASRVNSFGQVRDSPVGLFLWRHSRELRTPEAREEFFARLSRLGVAGAKIDFFDHEHKEVIDLYTALLESAAKHRILVNFQAEAEGIDAETIVSRLVDAIR